MMDSGELTYLATLASEPVTQLSVLALVAKSGLEKVLLGETLGQCGACQCIGLIGTVSQKELVKYVVAESAFAEIGQTYGAALIGVEQRILEEIQCELVGNEH